jgi:CheY-like chemotaxis protein
MRQRILFVSDGVFDQKLRSALAERRFEITESDPARALAQLTDETFDLLIIDLCDATEAVDLLKTVRAESRHRNLQTLVIAEWGSGQPTLALSQGADAFERAPIDVPRLVESVEKLLRPRLVMTARASTADGEPED